MVESIRAAEQKARAICLTRKKFRNIRIRTCSQRGTQNCRGMLMRKRFKLVALLASGVALSWLMPISALAQQGTAADVDAPATRVGGGLEDIVVTAQRRSESAQSVPISLQSFSSESLQKSAVRSTEDLTVAVGGLIIQPTAGRPQLFIRGVGTNSTNTTPSVLTFVDGVVVGLR